MTGLFSRFALIFLAGAFFGTAYDYIHVRFNVLTYHHPDFAGTVLAFVPLEFGVAAVVGSVAAGLLARRFAPPSVTLRRIALDAALLLIGYLLTGFFNGNNFITFLALVPVAAVSVATRPTAFVVIASAAAGLVGPLSEICVSSADVFHYNHSALIPYWLPLLWVIAAGAFLDLPLYVLGERGFPVARTRPSA